MYWNSISAITVWLKPACEVNATCEEARGLFLPSHKRGISYWLTPQSKIYDRELKRRCWMQIYPCSHESRCEQHKVQLQSWQYSQFIYFRPVCFFAGRINRFPCSILDCNHFTLPKSFRIWSRKHSNHGGESMETLKITFTNTTLCWVN